MLTIDYKGKVVLVTGGGRGIGLAITKAFAKAGATLVITYTSTDPSSIVQSISEEFSVPVHAYKCAAQNSAQVNELVANVQKDVGEVDVVICNAGVALWKEATDMSDEELHNIFSINTYGPYYLSRALMRSWLKLPIAIPTGATNGSDLPQPTKGQGLNKQIVFVSSISAQVAMVPQKQTAYNASKAALGMLGKSLAGEWAKYGVTVNMISPGYVATDMIANPPPGEGAEWVKTWADKTPVGRFAEPSEIANTLVLMCSEHSSSFMTGSDVVIDGGYTIF